MIPVAIVTGLSFREAHFSADLVTLFCTLTIGVSSGVSGLLELLVPDGPEEVDQATHKKKFRFMGLLFFCPAAELFRELLNLAHSFTLLFRNFSASGHVA